MLVRKVQNSDIGQNIYDINSIRKNDVKPRRVFLSS